ncbi:hypothetical protein FAES_3092 [Fibrella aestuarina BUZ 2]|uniref:Outer membrane protein beta-barrel domain-containing protein n=1 Tax=Fibrella aestuarina BUZ 2 TaxID=1166018 RepID=I0KAE8_9BACT|nr:hypothetical protein [Fibrella aestuarina]CCH01101.1 hypothetical protein FAES_3092 [Fibrella aestuarina BUZ 2]
MKTILFACLLLAPLSALAQEQAYEVAVSYGAFTSPSFNQQKARDYFSADFDYHLSRRWTIASGFMTGRFNYFDNTRSNDPTGILYGPDGTNARGYELYGYGMAKYALVKTSGFTLQLGAGIGFFNQRLTYPYRATYATGSSLYTEESSFTDLALPVTLEAYYVFNQRIGLGLKAGGYIEPDFPVVGAHIGPQLRVRL